MKRAAVLFILSWMLIWPSFAEDKQSFIAPLADQSLLLDITKTEANRLIAVGERGHILISDDGKSWQQRPVPTQSTLTTVFSAYGHAWAAGHDAVILHSDDGGMSWKKVHQDIELQKPLMDLYFFNDQSGIAIGAYGLFYRTVDGGQNWQKERHLSLLSEMDQEYLLDLKENDPEFYEIEVGSIFPHLNRVARGEDGTLYLAAEMGTIAKSSDKGQSWQRMPINYYGSFFGIDITLSGRVIAAGLRGNAFELVDGNQWQKIKSGIDSTFNSVVPLPNGGALLVANKGYRLQIGAQNQLSQWPEEKAILNAVPFNGRLVAVTEVGIQVFDTKDLL
ncbi:hypothetical protein HMF8227_01419 [Saliniradius amylolyticus]|uniref:Photosynthesis system II assembly factor Ycf48/Hcf136-like domain-containing protein n=1 Tax=Saliniradius amylolyticus TaxID=2183582 RepID=A0A2S2E2N2_9ALTE|nr:YCF48-related protein [Saliniradius amylolyticus]AWL11894.1 hypothetical protein HMF8227_01419 [Saliniradius amylolyticus]